MVPCAVVLLAMAVALLAPQTVGFNSEAAGRAMKRGFRAPSVGKSVD